MDAVPENIDPDAVESFLASVKGVTEVHDLHIWAMSTTEASLTAHLVAPGGLSDATLSTTRLELKEHFRIAHSTIQVECGDLDEECAQAEETAV